MTSTVTIGERIDQLAAVHPESTAVIAIDGRGQERILTWREMSAATDRAAANLAQAGVDATAVVGVALPNLLDHIFATVGAWKLGALVLTLDPAAPEVEGRAVRETARPTLVVGEGPADQLHPATLLQPCDQLPVERGRRPRSASCSGGSTGRPRVLVRNRDWVYRSDELPAENDRDVGLRLNQVQLVMLPLYHSGFTALYHGLALDHQIVLVERFEPGRFAPLVERHRVNVLRVVPTMMRMILAAPNARWHDLSSIEAVHQGGASCAVAVKREWLELIGAAKVHEGYSSQERIGAVWIRGDEWLKRPGSVGKPRNCEIRIVDETGSPVAPGVVGEIYIRSSFGRQPTYLGSGPPLPEHGGFLSLGDMGYLDEDGYLFIVDRRTDMINVGGIKVYPAEVESVLLERLDIADVAVVGIKHDTLGQVPCAFVVPTQGGEIPDQLELYHHCRERLAIAKVPAKYMFRSSLPRAENGKLQRGALRDSLT